MATVLTNEVTVLKTSRNDFISCKDIFVLLLLLLLFLKLQQSFLCPNVYDKTPIKLMPLAPIIRPQKVIELNPFSSLNPENTESSMYVDQSELAICCCTCELCDQPIRLMSVLIMRLS